MNHIDPTREQFDAFKEPDRAPSMKYYSDLDFFFNRWLMLQEEQQRRNKEKRKAKARKRKAKGGQGTTTRKVMSCCSTSSRLLVRPAECRAKLAPRKHAPRKLTCSTAAPLFFRCAKSKSRSTTS